MKGQEKAFLISLSLEPRTKGFAEKKKEGSLSSTSHEEGLPLDSRVEWRKSTQTGGRKNEKRGGKKRSPPNLPKVEKGRSINSPSGRKSALL